MSKPNKDGWIRHRGGKCPVDDCALVDIRCRDGAIYSRKAVECHWALQGTKFEIMAYRLHKPEQVEPAVVANVEAFNARAEMPAAKYFDGPLQWRDRIREIDSERFVAELAHQGLIDRFEHERVSLVQKLEAEGFRLIGVGKPDNASIASAIVDQARGYYSEPAEDMSDWRNWKVGDLVECIDCEGWGGTFQENCLYPLTLVRDDGFSVRNDFVSVYTDNFRWHSRPSS